MIPRGLLGATTLLILVGCLMGCEVRPSNPFDPDTPPAHQALGRIEGVIQAVLEPDDDGTVPEASFCSRREGDHSGFMLLLRSLVASDHADIIRAQSQETLESGAFVFEGVPAGRYALEIVRPGFQVPLPRTLEVLPGETQRLAPLCAVSTTPPPRPLIEPLPAEVGPTPAGEPAAMLQVLFPEPSLQYLVEQIPEGEAEGAPPLLTPEDASEPVPLELQTADDTPARRTWRVRVRARDGLGNESEAAEATIVRDTLAPPEVPATAVQVAPGRDRLRASWPVLSAPADDAPSRWLVSYGLLPRPERAGEPCAFGRPGTVEPDPYGSATFALEGPSPVASMVPEITLSGLLPGTEVFLHVAALDRVGNASCYSAPVVVRPDEVTPVLVAEASFPAVSAAARTASRDGVVAFARGSGGLVVVDRGGSSHTVSGLAVADDVLFDGPRLFVASGAGVAIASVDDEGVPGEPQTLDTGADLVRRLAWRPGRLFLGTADAGGDGGGVRTLHLDDGTLGPLVPAGGRDAAVEALASRGDALVLVRAPSAASGTQEPRALQVVDLENSTLARGESLELPNAPRVMRLLGDEAWLAFPTGLRVFSVEGCNAGSSGCLGPPRVLDLPGGASPVDIASFDDLALVLAAGDGEDPSTGGVFLYASTPGLRLVGRAFLPAADFIPERLFVENAGFCATGSRAGSPASVCWTTASQGQPEGQARVVLSGDARWVAQHERDTWVAEDVGSGAALTRVDFSLGAVTHRHLLPASAGLARVEVLLPLPSVGALALDSDGRLFSTSLSERLNDSGVFPFAEEVLDADGLGLDDALLALDGALTPPLQGFGALDGSTLVLALRPAGASESEAWLVRLSLVEKPAGLGFTAVEGMRLGDLSRVTRVLLHRGRALVSGFPSGLAVIALDEELTLLEQESIPFGEGPGDGVVEVVLLEREGNGRALLVSDVTGGTGQLGTRFDWLEDDGSLVSIAADVSGRLNAAAAFGPWLATAARGTGVRVLEPVVEAGREASLRALLQIPTVPLFTDIAATRRGLLVGDGAAGVEWTTLR